MNSTIKIHDDDGKIVGEEIISASLILHSTVTEDGFHDYKFISSQEVNRIVMVCPEEGEIFYQVFEYLSAISSFPNPLFLDQGFEGRMAQGAEVFITDSSNKEDIGEALEFSGDTYMLHGAVVSDSKLAEIESPDESIVGNAAYNFYNGKTSKLIASLPLVSSYHSSNFFHTINVKFSGLGERRVDLYFLKEV